jgi:inorganic pyrophosphatase
MLRIHLTAHRIPSSSGKKPPDLIYVVIEIPKNSNIKYEVDVRNEILYVDRILPTPIVYPCNYGFIPNTIESGSNDPMDVSIMENESLLPFSVVSVRPVGVLLTEDQDGNDNKIIAVPDNSVDPEFSDIGTISEIPQQFQRKLEYFVKHHKDLEEGKYVRLIGWEGKDVATRMILESITRYQNKLNK